LSSPDFSILPLGLNKNNSSANTEKAIHFETTREASEVSFYRSPQVLSNVARM
jgi:hypothetical protein